LLSSFNIGSFPIGFPFILEDSGAIVESFTFQWASSLALDKLQARRTWWRPFAVYALIPKEAILSFFFFPFTGNLGWKIRPNQLGWWKRCCWTTRRLSKQRLNLEDSQQ
jgi:hypothetical protein